MSQHQGMTPTSREARLLATFRDLEDYQIRTRDGVLGIIVDAFHEILRSTPPAAPQERIQQLEDGIDAADRLMSGYIDRVLPAAAWSAWRREHRAALCEATPPAAGATPEPAPACKCNGCGTAINEGEAKVFGVCDACWDKAHSKPSPAGASEPSDDPWAKLELNGKGWPCKWSDHIKPPQLVYIAADVDRTRYRLATSPHAEPERCVWTLTPQGAAIVGCRAAIIVWQHMSMSAWTHCPYCGKPLTLSPTTTETP